MDEDDLTPTKTGLPQRQTLRKSRFPQLNQRFETTQ